MKTYPDYFSYRNTSNAEKKLFNLFKSIELDGFTYCLHSQNLKEHGSKRVAEIDFMLLGPRGILVIEVKGGRVQPTDKGWAFTDGAGNVTYKHEGPFEQAAGAMFSLEKLIQQDIPHLNSKPIFGYAVIFPDQEFEVPKNASWDKALVLDSRDFVDKKFASSILRAFGYWANKVKGSQQYGRLSDSDVAKILEYCRPQFEQFETLRSLSNSFDSRLVELSAPALGALELMAENERILVTGGAGTGKTLLAMSHVERLLSQGKRVLFTAKSQNIVELFQDRFKGQDLTSLSFARLKLWQGEQIDALVIDEAQDLANFKDLDVIDKALDGVIDNGRWLICLDPNLQAGVVGNFDEESFEYLKAFGTKVNLTKNVRNTPAIVHFIERRLRIPLSDLDDTFGKAPEILSAKDKATMLEKIQNYIEMLFEQGIEAADIVLLSGQKFSESLFSEMAEPLKQTISDMDSTGFLQRAKNRILFSSVSEFKGLEAKYVIYEPSKVPPELQEKTDYVAFTRARHGLAVIDFREKALQ